MRHQFIHCALACALLPAMLAPAAPVTALETSFITPPAAARPWVYWMGVNGNLTKSGITADLEAMARVGLGGALYMEVGGQAPAGAAEFAGPLWMEMMSHMLREAKRVGIEVNMNNDGGWSGSGGPWIKPEMAMQTVVWSETVVDSTGGKPLSAPLPQPKAEMGFYRDIAVLAMPVPTADVRLADFEKKSSSQFRAGVVNRKSIPIGETDIPTTTADFKEAAIGTTIPRNEIIDLTAQMTSAGTLTWTPPSGKWLVMRFGHTTTGVTNRTSPNGGKGLESDKLSREASTFQFDNLMQKIITRNRSLSGQDKTLVGVHIDSWEEGTQNWTPKMRAEFRQRRGYDILPFLPTLSGRVVGSTEITERFWWDLRQTVAELVTENFAGTFRELANKNGLRLTIEAYGAPTIDMAYAAQADEPMAEFWAWNPFRCAQVCTEMTSAAHTYGKRIVAAESFTSGSPEKWQSHPGNIKELGDWAFCEGINRFVIHRYAAQPWTDVAPGMSMGPFGLHYERTQTWWEQSKAWHQYLTRCQSLLQQGQFMADIAYLAPEGAPREFKAPPEAELAPHIRSGYGWDGCSADVVLTRMSVTGGRLVLPDGMSYRALVLPEAESMTPALLTKIQQLADGGAMIVGPATPPVKSPSLADLGTGDAKLGITAAALWASGKILTGKTAQEFLAERGVPPDFSANPLLRYTHRRIGEAEVYFVANPQAVQVVAVAGFRVTGKQPELWWPDTGRMESLVSFQETHGVTRVPIQLDSNGSVFVVFRRPSAGMDPVVALQYEGKTQWNLTNPAAACNNPKAAKDEPGPAEPAADLHGEADKGMVLAASRAGRYDLQTASGKTRMVTVPALPAAHALAGPWRVRFDPAAGGPGEVTFARLEDWSQRPEDGIRYYSGTADYQTTFVAGPLVPNQTWLLDLGKVEVMAEVLLNGKNLGILWKSPCRVDVSSALVAGVNRLEVKVVNLWINRQIGDETLPEDSAREVKGNLKTWPQWLQQDKPSPTGRFSFTTWRLWKKRDKLRASGLIGPVVLHPSMTVLMP